MEDEFKHVSPPRFKVRAFISADGGDWVAGHEEVYDVQEGTLDEAVEWMKNNVSGYGENDEQAVREWAGGIEEEMN